MVKRDFDKKLFGKRVAKFREQRNFTQGILAELVGCSESMVGQVEQGKKGTSLASALLIARALGTDIRELTRGCMEDDSDGDNGVHGRGSGGGSED